MNEKRQAANDIAEVIAAGRNVDKKPWEIVGDVWDIASGGTGDDPLSDAPQELIDEAAAFMRDATWAYAKTMADNRHWYVVETKLDDPRVSALKELLRNHSRLRRWRGHPYRALDLDDWSIWDLWPVINRKPTHYAGWDGDPEPPADWLPDEMRRDLQGPEGVPGRPEAKASE